MDRILWHVFYSYCKDAREAVLAREKASKGVYPNAINLDRTENVDDMQGRFDILNFVIYMHLFVYTYVCRLLIYVIFVYMVYNLYY
jgi:hypothetical protein